MDNRYDEDIFASFERQRARDKQKKEKSKSREDESKFLDSLQENRKYDNKKKKHK